MEERVPALVSVFSEATKRYDDERAAELVSLILRAIGDVRLNICPTDEEVAELRCCKEDWQKNKVRDDHARDSRVKLLHDLWCTEVPSPDEEKYSSTRGFEDLQRLALVKTRSVIIREMLEAWAKANSDDRAEAYWNSLLRLSFGTRLANQDYLEHDDLLVIALRDATDKNILVSRLDQAINSLFENRLGHEGYKSFQLLRRNGKDRDSILRVLLIARARNVKIDRVNQEIPVLSAVEGASGAAYLALLDEAKKIKAQDTAGQELLTLIEKRKPGVLYDEEAIRGDVSLEFPDRLTMVVKILWDDKKDQYHRRPKDATLHRWVETALEHGVSWRKKYNANYSPSMKVVVRLFTRKAYDELGEEPFREEIVK